MNMDGVVYHNMDLHEQRRIVLDRVVADLEIEPEDGEVLWSMAELGWVEIGPHGQPSITDRGLERHHAWGGAAA